MSKKDLLSVSRFWSVVLASTLIVFFILFRWIFQEWHQVNNELVRNREELVYLTSLMDGRKKLHQEDRQLKETLGSRTHPEAEMNLLIQQIEKLAGSEKIILNGVRPGRMEKKDSSLFLDVEVELEGNIVQIIRFLYQLMHSPDLVKVKRLSLSGKGKTSPHLMVALQVSKVLFQ